MMSLVKIVALSVMMVSVAASVPSFCKCTCFTNSTIIPLSSYPQTQSPEKYESRAPLVGCATCDKAFCLSQRLPICKHAEDKDVVTLCFQRDSLQDQIVVLTFIAGTVGLLVWAAIKSFMERRKLRQNHSHHEYAMIDG